MKIKNLRYGNSDILELVIDTAFPFENTQKGTLVHIVYSERIEKYIIKFFKEDKENFAVFHTNDKRNTNLLNDLLVVNIPFLAYILEISENDGVFKIMVEVYRFTKEIEFDNQISIEVDDKIFSEIKSKYLLNDKSLDACFGFLKKEFLLKRYNNGIRKNIFLSMGVTEDIKDAENESFRMYGETIVADIKNSGGKLIIQRITSNTYSKQNNKETVFLGTADVKFTDSAEALRLASVNQIKQLAETGRSLLEHWAKYTEFERDAMFEKMKNIGCFYYDKVDILDNDKYTCYLNDIDGNLSTNLEKTYEYIRSLDETPDLAVNEKIPKEIVQYVALPGDFEIKGQKDKSKSLTVKLKNIDLPSLTITVSLSDDDSPFPESGFIFYAFSGDKTQLDRKEDAKERIALSKNPMPQLAALLENIPTTNARVKRIKPISSKLIQKLKNRPPTKAQEEAIKIALNTPDIALIQGPPGTGKTTVITSVIERLAEELEENEELNATILLSSYQHDAVENATSRIVINGLPALKLGKNGSMNDSARNTAELWVEEQEQKINQKIIELPVSEIYKNLRLKLNSYFQSTGSFNETLHLLKTIKNDLNGKNLISPELFVRLDKEIANLENQIKIKGIKDSKIVKLIRGLRVDPTAFLDDGATKAFNFLQYLKEKNVENILDENELSIINECAESNNQIPGCLNDLGKIKESLLDRCIPSKKSSFNYMKNHNLSEFLTDILENVNQTVLKSDKGPASVLYEYLNDLNYDPDGVIEMIAHYTTVLAASCQQSDSKRMYMFKNNDLVYDTVIIDEAARATPLDLLIPMSQAKRRIILVGDHRQLPHMVEDKIVKKMEENSDDEINIEELLKESLFETLFKNLKELEKKTGVKRCITLDKQFRTTHKLGDFISKNFYESEGEPYISSGMPDEKLQHNLKKYADKCISWIDVPWSAGKEKSGKSKSRPIEAMVVAQEIKNLIEENPELTYGVITFYSAQCDLIKKELKKLGLAIDELQKTDKLRVGSIDAFQGREFDVVLLSTTRSNKYKAAGKELRRKYGFMTFPNRLCVAMSRQKRLLIAVGDSDMFIIDGAQKAIPQMYNFYKLCEKDGIVRRYTEII